MSGFPWTFIRHFLHFRVVHPPQSEFNPGGGVTKPPFELSRHFVVSWPDFQIASSRLGFGRGGATIFGHSLVCDAPPA
eukprot:161792-Amphidinium_carterae.1